VKKAFELYVIPKTDGGYALFSTPEAIHVMEEEYGDCVKQVIDWIIRRKNRIVSWVGQVLSKAHDYYVRLEDRIDPAERVLKAMASTNRFVVHGYASQEFQRLVRRQRLKHAFWFTIDFMLSGVVLLLTPVLAPLPGPNVFFYYPFLRVLSHYRAVLGATSGLDSTDIEFKSLPELRALEDNLPGLTRFLERMNS
jgi:hypothetical protein